VAAAVVVVAVSVAGGCALKQRSEDSFCMQLKVVRDLDEVLAGGDAGRITERSRELQDLRSVAPDEIEPQITRLAAVTEDLARTMGTVPDADAAASEVFTRRHAELPEITAAGRTVETYAHEHCQVALNPSGTAPSTSTGPAPSEPATTVAPATTRAPAATRPRTTSPPASTRSTRATTTTRRPATSRRATTTTTRRR
jgi:hypothetical protein